METVAKENNDVRFFFPIYVPSIIIVDERTPVSRLTALFYLVLCNSRDTLVAARDFSKRIPSSSSFQTSLVAYAQPLPAS